jgi:hypothetical protein
VANECLHIPSDEELSSRSAWRKSGNDTYSAVRAHILVVKRKEEGSPKGPPALTIDLPARTEFIRERKIGTLTKYTAEILSSIQETVTSKFTKELMEKIGAEIGINPTAWPSAKLTTEIQAKAGVELTKAVQGTLAVKKSYEQQLTNDLTYSLKYMADEGAGRKQTTITLYPRLSHWRWEFYLHKVEILSLRYRKPWYWREIRDSMVFSEDSLLRPLFCVRFYEPEEQLSMTDETYVPDVVDADEIFIEPLQGTPRRNGCGVGTPFQDLAKLAFPVTKEEKATAVRRVGPRKAVAAKKAAAKKAAPKKAAAKKAARKSAATRRTAARSPARTR